MKPSPVSSHTKVIAANFLHGVDPLWQDFLYELLDNASIKDIPIDFNTASSPLPRQLRNSCVMKKFKDGTQEYVSSQIWLAIDENGKRTIIEPKETSGVLLEGETGKIIKPFNFLPEITPRGTRHLVRILLRQEMDPESLALVQTMRWTLFTQSFS